MMMSSSAGTENLKPGAAKAPTARSWIIIIMVGVGVAAALGIGFGCGFGLRKSRRTPTFTASPDAVDEAANALPQLQPVGGAGRQAVRTTPASRNGGASLLGANAVPQQQSVGGAGRQAARTTPPAPRSDGAFLPAANAVPQLEPVEDFLIITTGFGDPKMDWGIIMSNYFYHLFARLPYPEVKRVKIIHYDSALTDERADNIRHAINRAAKGYMLAQDRGAQQGVGAQGEDFRYQPTHIILDQSAEKTRWERPSTTSSGTSDEGNGTPGTPVLWKLDVDANEVTSEISSAKWTYRPALEDVTSEFRRKLLDAESLKEDFESRKRRNSSAFVLIMNSAHCFNLSSSGEPSLGQVEVSLGTPHERNPLSDDAHQPLPWLPKEIETRRAAIYYPEYLGAGFEDGELSSVRVLNGIASAREEHIFNLPERKDAIQHDSGFLHNMPRFKVIHDAEGQAHHRVVAETTSQFARSIGSNEGGATRPEGQSTPTQYANSGEDNLVMQALLWLFDWSRSLSDTVDEGANMGRVQALKEHLLGNLPTEDKWIREQRRSILDDLRSMINYDFSGTRPFHYPSDGPLAKANVGGIMYFVIVNSIDLWNQLQVFENVRREYIYAAVIDAIARLMLNLILTPEHVAEGFLSAACASSLVTASLGAAVESDDAQVAALKRMSLQSHREECLNRSIKVANFRGAFLVPGDFDRVRDRGLWSVYFGEPA